MEITVLCYGDSNTWGYVPISLNESSVGIRRYSRKERWPTVLQGIIGQDYYVIEEGLNGRTTNLDYHFSPNRNGKTYLPPCLYTHSPIDLVILALGGNDLKIYFNRNAKDIRNGLSELVDIIQASKYGERMQKSPKVLILTVPVPLSVGEKFVDENGVFVFEGAIDKAKSLIELYADLAKEKNCYFLDTSNDICPSEIDGLHLDAIGHKKLALMIAAKIDNIFYKK